MSKTAPKKIEPKAKRPKAIKPAAKAKPIREPLPPAISSLDEQRMATQTRTILLSTLITKGMQQRVGGLDKETVATYTAIYNDKDHGGPGAMPPIVVFTNGAENYLADGHHRAAAANAAGMDGLPAIIKKGDRRAAVLYAIRSNHEHGLALNNDDKRNNVRTLLADPEWRQWSDRVIARESGASASLVQKMRAKLPADQQPATRKGRDGRELNTKAIGKNRPAPQAKDSAPAPSLTNGEIRRRIMQSINESPDPAEGQSPKEIASHTGMSQHEVNSGIEELCSAGKLALGKDPNRPNAFLITPKGLAEIDAGQPQRDEPEPRDETDVRPEPEEMNASTIASTAGEPAVERSTPPIADDTPAARVLKRTREILADRLLKGKDQCRASSEQLVSLGLVVGIPVSADDEPWNDDLVAGCWHKLSTRLKAEVADYLTRGETRRLPPLEQLAHWWGIDIRAVAIQAERAVKG